MLDWTWSTDKAIMDYLFALYASGEWRVKAEIYEQRMLAIEMKINFYFQWIVDDEKVYLKNIQKYIYIKY